MALLRGDRRRTLIGGAMPSARFPRALFCRSRRGAGLEIVTVNLQNASPVTIRIVGSIKSCRLESCLGALDMPLELPGRTTTPLRVELSSHPAIPARLKTP